MGLNSFPTVKIGDRIVVTSGVHKDSTGAVRWTSLGADGGRRVALDCDDGNIYTLSDDRSSYKLEDASGDWDAVKEGDRIALVAMPNDPDPIPIGTRGWVTGKVDLDRGGFQLWVNWDVGRSLCLVTGSDTERGDEFRVLSGAERHAEQELELEADRIRATRQFFPPRKRTREEKATIMGSHLW